MFSRQLTVFVALGFLALPTASALAQDATPPATTTPTVVADTDDDDGFDLGWLGLLGLAGLLGLRGRGDRVTTTRT